MSFQQTLKTKITVTGKGLHSGKTVGVTLNSAPENSGVSFTRTDLAENNHISLIPKAVITTQLQTVIANPQGASVATVEHLLSALYALGVDNCHIEMDGEECPILDGSAMPWVNAIQQVGIETQQEIRKTLVIKAPIKIMEGESVLEALPLENPAEDKLIINITVDFPSIGQQKFEFTLTPDTIANYIKEIAPARTFCQKRDIDAMLAAGLIKGGSLECAVVFNDDGISLSKEALRFENEPVRHKLLDAIGDLSLANRRITGHLNLIRPGHKLNNQLLQKIIA